MREFMFVISMWGNDGAMDHYIGQMVLQKSMTEPQCISLIQQEMWASSYDNEHYTMRLHCYPKDCAGKEKCE
tara:strand:+ start:507 stop:722 length:216 start_codon:yes stop_codon:yes gene_type:complete